VTHFEMTLADTKTARAALVDVDFNTHLLLYDGKITSVLQRKKMAVPLEYQWPIITALSKTSLAPITRLWAGLKSEALPNVILRSFQREGARYIVRNAFSASEKAWRVVSILDMFSCGPRQLSTFAKLEEARDLCLGLKAGCQSENEMHAVAALQGATLDETEVGVRLMCGKSIDARAALHVPNEGAVLVDLSTRLRRLYERALEQHPQAQTLKAKIW